MMFAGTAFAAPMRHTRGAAMLRSPIDDVAAALSSARDWTRLSPEIFPDASRIDVYEDRNAVETDSIEVTVGGRGDPTIRLILRLRAEGDDTAAEVLLDASTQTQDGIRQIATDLVDHLRATFHPKRGSRAWFGDGAGYGVQVFVADLASVATVPIIIAADYAGDGSTHSKWGGYPFAMIAPSLMAPIVHLVNDRRWPALISFIGWATVGGMSALMDAWWGADVYRGSLHSATAGLPAGLTMATAGAVLMSALDVFLARPVTRRF
jgi:hypothetical protein